MFKYFKYFIIYFEFIDLIKKKNKYEFNLKEFINYSKLDEQTSRRILNNLVILNKLEKKTYYKSNKIKYLIK